MNYFDYNSFDEDDNDDTSPATPEESWTQMSPSKAPWESQEDYEDRMKDLDDYGEYDD